MNSLLAVSPLLVSSRRLARWAPLALWPLIAALVVAGGPATGTSLNPARSLGPAVVFEALGPLWLYLAGPLLGPLAVAAGWRLLGVEPKTAKLFHDPRYACSLATAMPAAAPSGVR